MARLNTDGPKAPGWPLACVTVPSQAVLLSDLQARLAAGQGFSVATMNLDHVVKLHRDPAFRHAYATQSHVTADGRPIVWMSALAGHPVELVTGSDLVEPLMALCARQGAPVAIVGSTADVLERAAAVLKDRHPKLAVAGLIAPPMGFEPRGADLELLLDDLAGLGARVCLLALGAPKQEILAAAAARRLPGTGFVSVGAGVDFVAGAQQRAPRLVRALALEWVWRLVRNPRRLAGRYAACIGVLPSLARTALTCRRAHRYGTTPE